MDSKGCPEEFYTKVEQYETFKKIADTKALDFESKITSKKVDGESVLIERTGIGNYFNSIYGIKSSTLIKVMGACTVDENQQNCEQKYLDFYAYLEPLK